MNDAERRDSSGIPPPANEVHRRIASEAARLRHGKYGQHATPEIDAVMAAATAAIQSNMPTKFVHGGRTYWLRFSVVMAFLEVFDSPSERLPLTMAMTGDVEVFGHTPHG